MSAIQPVRIQRSRQHKQVSPNGLPIVYVGRPSKWGNPFKVTGEKGNWVVVNLNNEPIITCDKEEKALFYCVENYTDYITHEHNLGIIDIDDLKSKNLSCWCKSGKACHSDILLKLANT